MSAPEVVAASRSASSQVRMMAWTASSSVCRIDLRRLAAGASDDEMDARQPAFREGRIVGGEPPFEGRLQIGPDLLADDAVVAVARHEGDDRDEAVELVDAVEHPDARPFDQAQDRRGVLAQRRHGNLEQLVARIALEHVDQRLAGMVGRVEARLLDDRLCLRAQIGDLHHRARVGGRGEQADDPQFAGECALACRRS